MPNHFTRDELARLQHLRAVLLSIETRPEGTSAPRYWDFNRDLELYDTTFAQRIAWKWRAVFDELVERGFAPPTGAILDYGCGTGVAAREWLASPFAGGEAAPVVGLWDREPLARGYARERVEDEFEGVDVELFAHPPTARDVGDETVLLVSHVMDELLDPEVDELVALARNAAAVVWVEPGSRITSRRLSAARDALLDTFEVVAPCTHSERCGALRGDAERQWCHLFAEPAPEAFTEGRWSEFGRELGIDLRSVPYSYIALARQGAAPRAPGGARLIGRPRMQRGRALIDTCEADGLRDELFLQRLDKGLFKALDKGTVRTLDIERANDRIERIVRR